MQHRAALTHFTRNRRFKLQLNFKIKCGHDILQKTLWVDNKIDWIVIYGNTFAPTITIRNHFCPCLLWHMKLLNKTSPKNLKGRKKNDFFLKKIGIFLHKKERLSLSLKPLSWQTVHIDLNSSRLMRPVMYLPKLKASHAVHPQNSQCVLFICQQYLI